MSTAAVRGVVRQFVLDDPPTDAALVTRYARTRENAPFAELLRRHGPVVLGVCRRLLADRHAAEDAFQAVFLVLARKANMIRPPGSVGSWLYGVAVRTAKKAKVAAARRWRREMNLLASRGTREAGRRQPGESSAYPGAYAPGSPELKELRAIIDDELGRLSADLRAAVVLCDLGGKSRSQAARELGCPEGTIAARLHRARKLLADRLTRRGVTLPAAGLGAVLTPEAVSAAVSPDLARTTLAAAELFATGTAGSAVSPAAQLLAEGMIRTMSTGKYKLMLAAILTAGLTTGAGALWGAAAGPPSEPGGRVAAAPPVAERPPTKPVAPPAAAGPWREKAVLKDIEDMVFSVAFAPDGKSFAAGGLTRVSVAEWDATTLKRIRYETHDDEFNDPAAVAYSTDGKWRAITFRNGVEIQDRLGREPTVEIRQQGSRPRAVAFSPAEERVAGRPVHRLAFTDGRALWAKTWIDGGEPGTAKFGPLAGAPKIDGTPPAAVAYSPDGKRLVFIPNHKVDPANPVGKPDPAKATHWIAQVWGGGSGEPMMLLPHGFAPVTAVAWSPDGKLIATGGADGAVVLWDAATGKELRRFGTAKNRVHALAYSPDGKTLAVAGVSPTIGGNVALIHHATGVRVQIIRDFTTPPVAVAFSPDGKTLIVGCGNPDADPRKLTPEERKKAGEVRVFTADPDPAKSDKPDNVKAPPADEASEAQATEALKKWGGEVFPLDGNDGIIFGYKGWLSDADMKEAAVHLRKLPNLRAVSLNFTGVTDAGLASLADLPKLRELHLKATRVTDAGLTHLLKRSELRKIDLTLTRVSEKGLAELKKALPKAEILSSSTDNTTGEAKKLRGVWRGYRILPGNKKDEAEELFLVVAGDDIAWGIVAGPSAARSMGAGPFTVNPDSKPRSIDFEFTDGLPGNNSGPSRYLGIYRLESDTLTLCFRPARRGDAMRPTDLSPEDERVHMYIFKLQNE